MPGALYTLGGRALLGAAIWLSAGQAVAQNAAKGEFPDSWYYYGGQHQAVKTVRSLEGKAAPRLSLKDWIGEPQDLSRLRGKVVVVDFWATWCGPCRAAIPKNIKMVEKYKDRGLVVVGVHDSRRGFERMPDLVRRSKVNYPCAVDRNGVSARGWKVSFWPTYAVVDQKGVVRAAGLQPDRVESVVKALLPPDPADQNQQDGPGAEGSESLGALDDPAASLRDVPAAWLEGGADRRQRLARLAQSPTPPAIVSDLWLNSEPLSLGDLQGQVVLLDFWATWCGPCLGSIPTLNRLHAAYSGQGLVIIGVCGRRGVDKMPDVVESRKIRYPVCADGSGRLNRVYGVDGYPDYYLIDRQGRLRIADCRNGSIEEAIRFLLAE